MAASTTTTHDATTTLERELVITRRFDAPRQRVFEAWTDPQQAKAWWGPRDHPLTYLETAKAIGVAGPAASTGSTSIWRGLERDR
jgi:hypothetical protein